VAFESLRGREEPGFRRRWQIVFALVSILHGALIAAGIAYSYWHVEELTPPRLRVTFMSLAPLPPPPPTHPPASGREVTKRLAPPPPPPAGGHTGVKKTAIETKVSEPVSLPSAEIVQPPERPMLGKKEFRKHDDEYDEADDANWSASASVRKDSIDGKDFGDDHGVKGGVKGGTADGAIGGTLGGVGASQGPLSVSPRVGSLQKESGNMPPFSAVLMHGKAVYVVDTKICVSTTGAVYRLTIMKRSRTVLDDSVINTVKTWRYRPMTVNDRPVPFCYPVRFEFRSES
jgi:hypothetical protein